jgi:outer membrane protein assembly factor BamB
MKYAAQKPILWLMVTFATIATLAIVGFLAFTPQRLTLIGTPSPIQGDDWPTYLHDNQRTAASRETLLSPANASRLTRLWAFKTNAGIAASPTVVKGTVYIGSWDGYEYALDATTGFLKWKTFLGKTSGNCVPPLIGITSSATVQDNVVYVGGGDSYWYALDAYTGTVLWRIFTGDNSPTSGFYNWSSPLLYKDSAYIGIASNCDNPLVQGKLLKVDLQSHKIVATAQLVNNKEVGGGVWTSPSVDPSTNTIFVTTGTQNQPWQNLTQAIVSLDANTLKIKASWQIPPSQSGGDYDWGTTPILMTDSSGRRLVAGTNKNGFTYAFLRDNISAGPIWEQQTGLGGMCPPCGEGSVSSGTFANDTLFMAGGNTTIHNIGYPGAVRAIDPSTGKNKWEHGTPYPIIPAIAYVNGLLIDGEGPTIEVLNAHDGSRLYSYETGDMLYAPPAVSHGQIFMGSLDGNLYSFGLSNASDDSTSFTPCPHNWSCASVGTPKSNGSVRFSTSPWTLTGNGVGLADIFDQFQFVNQPLNGDSQITAKLDSFTNTNVASRTGLMFRQRLERSSPFYAANFLPDGTLNVQYRTAFLGGITSTLPFTPPGHPHFVAIQRNGDSFQASLSTDGKNYTLLPGSLVTLPFPSELIGGMFVSSGSTASNSSATFSALSIAPTTLEPLPSESPSACPDDWNCADVGNPSLVGNQLLHNGLWTVQGEGKDIWSTHDEFHYVWQSFPANSTISAHISNQLPTDPLAKAGLMLRADTSLDAPYYAAFFTPGSGLTVQARSIQGLDAQIVTTNLTMKQPGYLKIARWKNIFTTYLSSDGINWKPLLDSSLTIDIPGPILAGMVLTSHKNYQLGSANFDAVQADPTAIPAPTACPDSWSCADIGYPSPKGIQLFDDHNKVWTLQGGGFDIYFKADQFHYVWQETVGDSSISARVSYVSDDNDQGNGYAKAGVMFRQNTDAASPYYAAFLTPTHGVMVQYRQTTGALTGEALFPNPSHNALYLKILRTGDLYTAYVSQDSAAWQAVDGSTVAITMGDTLLMGLAVTSHNPGAVREVTFNDLNIS